MTFVFCGRCFNRLQQLGGGHSAPMSPAVLLRLPRRCLKPMTRPAPPPGGQQQHQPWFIRRLDQLPESPLRPQPLPASTSAALQLAARLAGAAVFGGALCLAVLERRRRQQGGGDDAGLTLLLPLDNGYYADTEAGSFAAELRRVSPFLGFCAVATLLGNLLRARRLSPGALSAVCRHALDQPGRSALLTSPWLSALCVFHASELLFAGIGLAVLCSINFGLTPGEKALAFLSGAWAGSAARCAYQMLPPAASAPLRFAHWQGPHAGLAALVCLLILGVRRDALRYQQQQQQQQRGNSSSIDDAVDVDGDGDAGPAQLPRSARRFLLELRPGLCAALLAGWAGIEAACLLLLRTARLHHASSLAGMAAGLVVHACVEGAGGGDRRRWRSGSGSSSSSSSLTVEAEPQPR